MIIVGAGGHAKEIAGVLAENGTVGSIFFYDDVTANLPDKLFGFRILKNEQEAKDVFATDPRFGLGVGGMQVRYDLAKRFTSWGGKLTSIISEKASISPFNVFLGEGANVMTGAVITSESHVGVGTLIHSLASLHHDTVIGDYCEISPGAHILGWVTVGDFSMVGSGAVILPRVKIGRNVIIGAGAVVTKDVPDGRSVKGVPAR